MDETGHTDVFSGNHHAELRPVIRKFLERSDGPLKKLVLLCTENLGIDMLDDSKPLLTSPTITLNEYQIDSDKIRCLTVMQRQYNVVSKGVISTFGAEPCRIVILYDPQTQTAGLAHIDSMTIISSLDSMLKDVLQSRDGSGTGQLLVYVSGFDDNYELDEKLEEYLKKHDLLSACYVARSTSMGINTITGHVGRYMYRGWNEGSMETSKLLCLYPCPLQKQ